MAMHSAVIGIIANPFVLLKWRRLFHRRALFETVGLIDTLILDQSISQWGLGDIFASPLLVIFTACRRAVRTALLLPCHTWT